MKDQKILYISSQVFPYFDTKISQSSLQIPKKMIERGNDVRLFMPRYGVVNERKFQLHEVIRLSRVNLSVNDFDQPLVVKVATVPDHKMQVYFTYNDEFFERKQLFRDEQNHLFEDNDERAIFFIKGVVETVKKLNWRPDYIHISGWFTHFLPLYLRTHYANYPLFSDSKIILSLFDENYEGSFSDDLIEKLECDHFDQEILSYFEDNSILNLTRQAMEYSDLVVKHDDHLPHEIHDFASELNLTLMDVDDESEKDPSLLYNSLLVSNMA